MSAETSAGATGAKGALEPVEPTAAQRTLARRVAEAKATIPDFQVSIASMPPRCRSARSSPPPAAR